MNLGVLLLPLLLALQSRLPARRRWLVDVALWAVIAAMLLGALLRGDALTAGVLLGGFVVGAVLSEWQKIDESLQVEQYKRDLETSRRTRA